MGWAARAQVSDGNPKAARLTGRCYRPLPESGTHVRMRDGREYDVDRSGALRRRHDVTTRGGGSETLQPGRPETGPEVPSRDGSK